MYSFLLTSIDTCSGINERIMGDGYVHIFKAKLNKSRNGYRTELAQLISCMLHTHTLLYSHLTVISSYFQDSFQSCISWLLSHFHPFSTSACSHALHLHHCSLLAFKDIASLPYAFSFSYQLSVRITVTSQVTNFHHFYLRCLPFILCPRFH